MRGVMAIIGVLYVTVSTSTAQQPPTSPAFELANELGSGMCNITKCCTEVCPEHIKITDNAIIPLKERVVDRFYDPVKRLMRLFGKDGGGR
jgi:hypothetical protein